MGGPGSAMGVANSLLQVLDAGGGGWMGEREGQAPSPAQQTCPGGGGWAPQAPSTAQKIRGGTGILPFAQDGRGRASLR